MATFHRDPDQAVKVRLIQYARCLLFPSKMGEPFGLVAAEAMACGTPVIALRDGAIGEVVEDGVTGAVVNDADGMSEALGRLDRYQPNACRERVTRLFSRGQMAKGYLSLYERVTEGGEF